MVVIFDHSSPCDVHVKTEMADLECSDLSKICIFSGFITRRAAGTGKSAISNFFELADFF